MHIFSFFSPTHAQIIIIFPFHSLRSVHRHAASPDRQSQSRFYTSFLYISLVDSSLVSTLVPSHLYRNHLSIISCHTPLSSQPSSSSTHFCHTSIQASPFFSCKYSEAIANSPAPTDQTSRIHACILSTI